MLVSTDHKFCLYLTGFGVPWSGALLLPRWWWRQCHHKVYSSFQHCNHPWCHRHTYWKVPSRHAHAHAKQVCAVWSTCEWRWVDNQKILIKVCISDALVNKAIQNTHSHKADITLLHGRIIIFEVSAKTSVVVDDENMWNPVIFAVLAQFGVTSRIVLLLVLRLYSG